MGGRSGAGEIFALYLGELEGRRTAVVSAPDAPALARAAHSLGSPSALVGAAGLATRCREIEMLARDGRTAAPDAIEELDAECARVRAAIEDLLAEDPRT